MTLKVRSLLISGTWNIGFIYVTVGLRSLPCSLFSCVNFWLVAAGSHLVMINYEILWIY